jgi:hypothetical protein
LSARRGTLAPRAECFCTHASVLTPPSPNELRTEVPVIVERIVLPKLPLNWFGYADGATADGAIADAAIDKVPITRTGIVYSFYRGRPTSLSLLVRVSSSRSASVSSCPHSHSKKVRAERQTDSGPPSTTFSLHSSQRRTTCLEESTTTIPPPGLYSVAGDTLSHLLGSHKMNLPRPHASSASPAAI